MIWQFAGGFEDCMQKWRLSLRVEMSLANKASLEALEKSGVPT